METLTEVRYTYACAACGYQTTVLRPDVSHARELALCARCDGQVWLGVADRAGPAARVGALLAGPKVRGRSGCGGTTDGSNRAYAAGGGALASYAVGDVRCPQQALPACTAMLAYRGGAWFMTVSCVIGSRVC
jgi:hypothetical protein